jgi:hypothetical protein
MEEELLCKAAQLVQLLQLGTRAEARPEEKAESLGSALALLRSTQPPDPVGVRMSVQLEKLFLQNVLDTANSVGKENSNGNSEFQCVLDPQDPRVVEIIREADEQFESISVEFAIFSTLIS